MGNYHFQFTQNTYISKYLQEWSQIQLNGKKIFKNKISEQQYIMFSNQSIKPDNYGRQYYSLPNTPKILIIPLSKFEINIFVEYANNNIQKILKLQQNSQSMLLQTLKCILQTVNWLRLKYGTFYINQSMIKVNNNNKILVWIHQDFLANAPQFPIPNDEGEQFMISKIIKIFSPFLSKYLFFQNKNTFNQFIAEVQVLIQQTMATDYFVKCSYENSGSKIKYNHISSNQTRNRKFKQCPQFIHKNISQQFINTFNREKSINNFKQRNTINRNILLKNQKLSPKIFNMCSPRKANNKHQEQIQQLILQQDRGLALSNKLKQKLNSCTSLNKTQIYHNRSKTKNQKTQPYLLQETKQNISNYKNKNIMKDMKFESFKKIKQKNNNYIFYNTTVIQKLNKQQRDSNSTQRVLTKQTSNSKLQLKQLVEKQFNMIYNA